jgi:hypothetical protein
MKGNNKKRDIKLKDNEKSKDSKIDKRSTRANSIGSAAVSSARVELSQQRIKKLFEKHNLPIDKVDQ